MQQIRVTAAMLQLLLLLLWFRLLSGAEDKPGPAGYSETFIHIICFFRAYFSVTSKEGVTSRLSSVFYNLTKTLQV